MLQFLMNNWVLCCLGIIGTLIYVMPRITYALRARPVEAGDPREGIVVFAEPLRWMGVRWGRCEAAAGLRRAAFRGKFLFWPWNPTWRAMLILPTLADSEFLERQSRRLAERIIKLRQTRPDSPIHVIGYSCGGFVATRAVELLPGNVRVDSLSLLAAAISPWRDLNLAAKSVRGPIIVSSSLLDMVVGVGTLIVGTADRVFTPSMGTLGYRGPKCDKIISLRWHPAWIRWGHWGSHFTAPAELFIANRLAPAMGLLPAKS